MLQTVSQLELGDAKVVRIQPRMVPYLSETEGHLILTPASALEGQKLTVRAFYGEQELVRRDIDAKRTVLEFPLGIMPEGENLIDCRIALRGEEIATVPVLVTKLSPKSNAVQIDNLRHGLVVDGLPYLPFGFYSHIANREMIDDQVFRGFNLFSPYSGGPHTQEERATIRDWMDRCAEVGMKVNYHARWGEKEWTEEVQEQLKAEIEAFRDHPALLSWYIADEPVGQGIAPDHLKQVYRFVKELDPYHPITVVFMASSQAAPFRNALDIAMVDPYPIPNGPVTEAGNAVKRVKSAFGYSKPVWVVPQAFGGAEWWAREPSAQEQRVMTYLALINGATGVQYFIYTPRLHPKSPRLWAECGNLALEASELVSALLSTEPRPQVACEPANIQSAAWQDQGIVTVIAVNTENVPGQLEVQLVDSSWTGKATVLFENREIGVAEGVITDVIDGFGTRVYQMSTESAKPSWVEISPNNLRHDPSFEEAPNVGTPDGFYVSAGKGTTYFLDTRTSVHGRHSLRLTAPSSEQVGIATAFPFYQKKGVVYRLSVWAKSDRPDTQIAVSMESLSTTSQTFSLTQEWTEYSFQGVSSEDRRSHTGLSFSGPGTIWLDLFQVVPLEAVTAEAR